MSKLKNGYTLIEVLIAILISMIILYVSYSMYSSGINVYDKLLGQKKNDEQMLLHFIKKDFEQLLCDTGKEYFYGEFNSLKFNILDLESGKIYEIEYKSNYLNESLIFERIKKEVKSQKIYTTTFFSGKNIKEISIKYYNEKKYYETQWNFEKKFIYPESIKIFILKGDGESKEYYLPIIIGRIY